MKSSKQAAILIKKEKKSLRLEQRKQKQIDYHKSRSGYRWWLFCGKLWPVVAIRRTVRVRSCVEDKLHCKLLNTVALTTDWLSLWNENIAYTWIRPAYTWIRLACTWIRPACTWIRPASMPGLMSAGNKKANRYIIRWSMSYMFAWYTVICVLINAQQLNTVDPF